MFICQFCSKEGKNHNSLINHERLCKQNPNRQKCGFELKKPGNHKRSNQFLKAKELGIAKYGCLTDEGRKKIAQKNKERGQSEEAKKKLSNSAKARGLGGHTSKQRLFFKKNTGEVVYLQSSYEIKFAQLLEELNIVWERPSPLTWIDGEGVDHKYYPDFKINDLYFDTKNDYLAIKDAFKIQQVQEQNNVTIKIVTYNYITKEYILNALVG